MSLALKLTLAPLLVAQALSTRRRAPVLPEAAGPRSGEIGDGRRLRLLIVGDSSGAGVGVPTQDIALAGYLSRTLALEARAKVQWQLVARSGITSAQALELVQSERPPRADVAVAVLGVNDVIDQVPVQRAVQHRAALADWLIAHAGVRHVVFAPLPPVHQFPLLPQPLRWIMGRDARRHDEALARWAGTRENVSHVPIAITLDASCMASDGFHPGEPVYRVCGEALARHIAITFPASETHP
ncbi:SGNH/GDSL hydrolase family protein [Piscinibacter sp. XHJ-5]|uniref:SGNH/GDSL hydrolase family protein n=1 Tax=Piscinibacter sp. XHJ-5 TaxID=3037797 RepID=UPI002452D167|nr:SGNH/GDSL hydrolase family protein [Piscinibacter sp. XHJ-5]